MIALMALYLLLAPIAAIRGISSESSLDIDDRIVHVTMFVMRNKSDHPSGLFIKANGHYESECSIPELFSSKWNARALSGKSVLVWLDDYKENGKRQAKFILVNVKDCKYRTVYVGALSEKYEIYKSTSPSDDTFTIMLRGKKYCQGHDWCRLHFDPSYQKLQPFDLDFSLDQLDDIHSATAFDANLFVVRHTDDTSTHRVRLYDLSNQQTILKYKELLAILNYTLSLNNTRFTEYPLKSSGLSLCWANFTLDNTTSFYCSEFSEHGNVALNLTVSYPGCSVVASYLVKTVPSQFLINMVFDRFKERDFSILPDLITGWGYIFEGMKNTSNNHDEYLWGNVFDSLSSEHRDSKAMVFVENE